MPALGVSRSSSVLIARRRQKRPFEARLFHGILDCPEFVRESPKSSVTLHRERGQHDRAPDSDRRRQRHELLCAFAGNNAVAGLRDTATTCLPSASIRLTTSRPTLPVAPVIKTIATLRCFEREPCDSDARAHSAPEFASQRRLPLCQPPTRQR